MSKNYTNELYLCADLYKKGLISEELFEIILKEYIGSYVNYNLSQYFDKVIQFDQRGFLYTK